MAQATRDVMTGDLDMIISLITRSLVELHLSGKIKNSGRDLTPSFFLNSSSVRAARAVLLRC